MLYLVNTKTNEIIKDSNGVTLLFSTNNEACEYAGSIKTSCWIESEFYNPKLTKDIKNEKS